MEVAGVVLRPSLPRKLLWMIVRTHTHVTTVAAFRSLNEGKSSTCKKIQARMPKERAGFKLLDSSKGSSLK